MEYLKRASNQILIINLSSISHFKSLNAFSVRFIVYPYTPITPYWTTGHKPLSDNTVI